MECNNRLCEEISKWERLPCRDFGTLSTQIRRDMEVAPTLNACECERCLVIR